MKSSLQNKDNLVVDLIQLIKKAQQSLAIQVNSTLTLVYWQVGNRINQEVLKGERAAYGKELIKGISEELVFHFGKSFVSRNLRRMIQFSELFPSFEIVSTLSTQLSWSHFMELFQLKNENALKYYITKISEEKWSVRQTRKQIESKAYERNQIATFQNPIENKENQIFKDPYILDFLNLQNGYLENV